MSSAFCCLLLLYVGVDFAGEKALPLSPPSGTPLFQFTCVRSKALLDKKQRKIGTSFNPKGL